MGIYLVDWQYSANFALANKKQTLHRGVEQLVARQAHNLEVVRSSRASATKRKDVKSFLFYFLQT